MELAPIGKKPFIQKVGDKLNFYLTADWIFSSPVEKLILIVLTLYSMYSFIRWLFW
jgi:hypothetical protein